MKKLFPIFILLILVVFLSRANGMPITDPSQLSPNPTIIDFETVNGANPLIIGDVTFTSVTASLSLLNVNTPSWPVAGDEVAGQTLFPGGEPDSAILITFANPVSEILLGWGDPNYDGNVLLAYDSNGYLLEQLAVPTGPINGVFATWVGFKREIADISRVLVHPQINDDYVIDNIHYNVNVPVPEPSTLLLLGSGLFGLWGLRRKFKN
jgi:hypothetical protein